MKNKLFPCLMIILLGPVLLAQTPHRWSVEAMIGKGFENNPERVLGLQGGYYFLASDQLRVGAGVGVCLSKPKSFVVPRIEMVLDATEWSVPAYLRGEYLVPSWTNGSIVFRADVGYRIGAKTTINEEDKNGTVSDTHYWSGVFIEPQIGLLVRDRLLFSIGYCLQRGQYSEIKFPDIVGVAVEGQSEIVHRFLPVLSFHLETRF